MSEDFAIFLNDFRQWLTEIQNLCAQLKAQVDKLMPQKWTWNPDAIKWEKTQGAKGEYERSEDVNNLEFKAMLKDLAVHNGRLTRDGMFYWVYKNGTTVGRKKQARR